MKPGLGLTVPLLLACSFVPPLSAQGGDEATAEFERQRESLASELHEMLRSLAQVRELPEPSEPPPLSLVTAAGIRQLIEDLSLEGRRREEIDRLGAFLHCLDLLPEGVDLSTALDGRSTHRVALVFDRANRRLVVDTETIYQHGVVGLPGVHHELVHYLEELRHGPALRAAWRARAGDDDAILALRSLVEGTATITTLENLQVQHGRERHSFGRPIAPLLRRAWVLQHAAWSNSPYLEEISIAPQADGAGFVQHLRTSGMSWKEIDQRLFDTPPVSMEQVLHPERYLSGEEPLLVSMPDGLDEILAADGWKGLGNSTAGELVLRLLSGPEAAEGWGGDRYRVFSRENERFLVWAIRFDTPDDAREFGLSFDRKLFVHTDLEASQVLLVSASEPELVQRIRALFQ